MTLAKVGRLVVGASLAVAMLLVVPTASGAQAYPPQGTAGPTVVMGQTFTDTLCGFAPGSKVTILVDGQSAGTMTASGSGCVPVTTTITSTKASVLGLLVNISCGANSITATGTTSSGATTSAASGFTLTCGSSVAAAGTGPAFTGANTNLEIEVAAGLFLVGGLLLFAYRRREQTEA